MTLKIILKGGEGSGHHGHAGRPGSRGGSVSGSAAMSIRTGKAAAERKAAKRAGSKKSVANLKVDSMTSAQKKTIEDAVIKVGEDRFGGADSGFIWDGDPKFADYGPKQAIALMNEMGVWEDAVLNAQDAGETISEGMEMGSAFGYTLSVDMTSGKSTSLGEIMPVAKMNKFYNDNPGKVLVTYETVSNVINVMHPGVVTQDVIDDVLKNTDAIANSYWEQAEG